MIPKAAHRQGLAAGARLVFGAPCDQLLVDRRRAADVRRKAIRADDGEVAGTPPLVDVCSLLGASDHRCPYEELNSVGCGRAHDYTCAGPDVVPVNRARLAKRVERPCAGAIRLDGLYEKPHHMSVKVPNSARNADDATNVLIRPRADNCDGWLRRGRYMGLCGRAANNNANDNSEDEEESPDDSGQNGGPTWCNWYAFQRRLRSRSFCWPAHRKFRHAMSISMPMDLRLVFG
jgi:hypothetical protein